ncbi:MAG: NADP-dependent oxidoreductase [Candidatus Eremiobacteraeota bacterium]|nr:NADP-dependent oxidoreductase [Candidatus Eremiobacteraeota bacterium]
MSSAAAFNRQVILRSRPAGIPQAANFDVVETAMPEPGEGEVLVRNRFLAVEPAMRGWVSAVTNYADPVPLGAVMRSFAAGEVVRSRNADYVPGDQVTGMFGWQEYAVADARTISRTVPRDDIPLSAALGVLGLNGLTAYFALLAVGAPKPGDTVLVSTAAGSVGSCVGQIAKILGCRTVGITGGARKVRLCLDEFGYDAAIDYKSGVDLDAAIGAAAPQGVHVYFDNTAGPISDTAYAHLAVGARIVVCGTASVSSWDPWPIGPRVERHLLVKRARMQGFLAFDYAARFPEAIAQLSAWIRDGRLRYREEFLDGIDAAPDAIAGLYRGENLGRRLIRLNEDR